jgi:type IV pilus assembly protein PilB
MRSFVRQDPDVILVGEIRDQETAQEAIRASQTGHLVLSTLHSNDAVDALQRLYDLGILPNSIAGELLAIIAQRLAKRICRMPPTGRARPGDPARVVSRPGAPGFAASRAAAASIAAGGVRGPGGRGRVHACQ